MVDPVAGGRNPTGARWRRAAVVLAAGVAAALLGGCGGARSGAPSPQSGQQLRWVLRAWSSFPVSASPRPLVLVGQRVADPLHGFPNGAAKLAYLERAVDIPAALPPGSAVADGSPLISAREALRVFKSTAGKGPPAAVRLTVTTVRVGTGVFQTGRGPRRLPAWLFPFGGVQDPAAVLAVAPARIFSPGLLSRSL